MYKSQAKAATNYADGDEYPGSSAYEMVNLYCVCVCWFIGVFFQLNYLLQSRGRCPLPTVYELMLSQSTLLSE
jgi:hypothetical protein